MRMYQAFSHMLSNIGFTTYGILEQRVQAHASQYVTHSTARDTLFLVHPYYYTGKDLDLPPSHDEYLKRLDQTLQTLDASQVRVVVADDARKYFASYLTQNSSQLVESGSVSEVLVTKRKYGIPSNNGSLELFYHIVRNSENIYVAGTSLPTCVSHLAYLVHKFDGIPLLIRDLVFDFKGKSTPEQTAQQVWEDALEMPDALSHIVESHKLPSSVHH